MVRYLFYTRTNGDLTYQSPLVHVVLWHFSQTHPAIDQTAIWLYEINTIKLH